MGYKFAYLDIIRYIVDMSIGNLKNQGNQGNNTPYQLRNLQLLDAINQSVIANGTPTVTVNATTTLPITAIDAFGRQRVSEPFTLFDSSHRYEDNGLWATSTNLGGTATFNADQGLVDLSIGSTANAFVKRETYKVFAYQPGKSLLVMSTFVMAGSFLGLRQRVGYYNDNNGYFFEKSGVTLSFVERSLVSGSVVDTPITQSNWNYDKMNGAGPSGVNLDTTKAQILWIDMEWLGVGSVRMGFVVNGQFYLCHTFQHANVIPSTYITTACLPLRYEIQNVTGTLANTTLKQICSTVISEGGYTLTGEQYSIGIPVTAPRTFAVAGTYYPIIGLKLTGTRLDAIAVLTALSLLGLGNGKNYAWRLVQRGSISGGTWVTTAGSAVEYNITGTSSSGGSVIASGYVNSSNQGSPVVNILKGALFSSQLERNGFTGAAFETILEATVSTTSGGEGMLASVDWEEITR